MIQSKARDYILLANTYINTDLSSIHTHQTYSDLSINFLQRAGLLGVELPSLNWAADLSGPVCRLVLRTSIHLRDTATTRLADVARRYDTARWAIQDVRNYARTVSKAIVFGLEHSPSVSCMGLPASTMTVELPDELP